MTKKSRRPVCRVLLLLSLFPACGKWAGEGKAPDVVKPPEAETPRTEGLAVPPRSEEPPVAVAPRTETPSTPAAVLPAKPPRPAPSIELARKAVAAIRAAGLEPPGEVKTAHTARPKMSERAAEAIRKAGLDMDAVQDGLKAYPQTLSETPEQIAEADRRAAGQRKEYERLVAEGLLERLPKDPQEGFGADTPGGEGGEVVAVTEPTQAAVEAAFAQAARSGKCRIEFRCAGDIDIGRPLPILRSPNVTVDGQGVATLWGSAIPPNRAVLSVSTSDVVLRNLRIRHGGDNISLGGEAYAGSSRVVISHVSTSASRDDGISAGWGARDVTIQWCLLAGNTRSIFIKYKGSTNVSVHHNLIEKQMIRGPLVSGKAFVDFRNNVVRNWLGWGSRFEDGGYGNAVNNLHVMSPFARKKSLKPDATIYRYNNPNAKVPPGAVYASGNVSRDCKEATASGADKPYDAPKVETQPVEEMEKAVMARAGCLPRDAIDRKYIDAESFTVSSSRPFLIGRDETAAPPAPPPKEGEGDE